jgi:hypothetical protein
VPRLFISLNDASIRILRLMHLNPIGGEAGPLNHDDQLIVLCRVFIQPTETLPTDPPIAPSVESK